MLMLQNLRDLTGWIMYLSLDLVYRIHMYTVSQKKNVTTFSMINWTITVCLH